MYSVFVLCIVLIVGCNSKPTDDVWLARAISGSYSLQPKPEPFYEDGTMTILMIQQLFLALTQVLLFWETAAASKWPRTMVFGGFRTIPLHFNRGINFSVLLTRMQRVLI